VRWVGLVGAGLVEVEHAPDLSGDIGPHPPDARPQQVLGTAVRKAEPAARVDERDGHRHALDQAHQAAFDLPEGLLCDDPGGEVTQGYRPHPPPVVGNGFSADLDVTGAAVFAHDDCPVRRLVAGGDLGLDHRAVFGRGVVERVGAYGLGSLVTEKGLEAVVDRQDDVVLVDEDGLKARFSEQPEALLTLGERDRYVLFGQTLVPYFQVTPSFC